MTPTSSLFSHPTNSFLKFQDFFLDLHLRFVYLRQRFLQRKWGEEWKKQSESPALAREKLGFLFWAIAIFQNNKEALEPYEKTIDFGESAVNIPDCHTGRSHVLPPWDRA
jgi:hypothetical protein